MLQDVWAEVFRFCVMWMLRELKLSNLNTDDILLDYINKRVTLNSKVSKMDRALQGYAGPLVLVCRQFMPGRVSLC
jgi:hypothetical protein